MNYLRQIMAFESWTEGNHLSKEAQLLWYKLLYINNKAEWTEWFSHTNIGLMAKTGINSEKTLVKIRNELINAGLLEYKKGKKGNPGKYRLIPFPEDKNTVKNTVENTGQPQENSRENDSTNAVETTDIYKHKQKQKHKQKDIDTAEKQKPKKIKYAEFVSMTEVEHQKLIERFGREKTARMIEVLDNYKGAKGRQYKSDYRAILSWVVDKVEQEFRNKSSPKGNLVPLSRRYSL
ncbi:MAG: hypothetical protein H0Z35_12500 [Thermoanaerobacteraceae bacterium]|nr:hypothetical protein [Thermoanaerobacteraceae bacterium]